MTPAAARERDGRTRYATSTDNMNPKPLTIQVTSFPPKPKTLRVRVQVENVVRVPPERVAHPEPLTPVERYFSSYFLSAPTRG